MQLRNFDKEIEKIKNDYDIIINNNIYKLYELKILLYDLNKIITENINFDVLYKQNKNTGAFKVKDKDRGESKKELIKYLNEYNIWDKIEQNFLENLYKKFEYFDIKQNFYFDLLNNSKNMIEYINLRNKEYNKLNLKEKLYLNYKKINNKFIIIYDKLFFYYFYKTINKLEINKLNEKIINYFKVLNKLFYDNIDKITYIPINKNSKLCIVNIYNFSIINNYKLEYDKILNRFKNIYNIYNNLNNQIKKYLPVNIYKNENDIDKIIIMTKIDKIMNKYTIRLKVKKDKIKIYEFKEYIKDKNCIYTKNDNIKLLEKLRKQKIISIIYLYPDYYYIKKLIKKYEIFKLNNILLENYNKFLNYYEIRTEIYLNNIINLLYLSNKYNIKLEYIIYKLHLLNNFFIVYNNNIIMNDNKIYYYYCDNNLINKEFNYYIILNNFNTNKIYSKKFKDNGKITLKLDNSYIYEKMQYMSYMDNIYKNKNNLIFNFILCNDNIIYNKDILRIVKYRYYTLISDKEAQNLIIGQIKYTKLPNILYYIFKLKNNKNNNNKINKKYEKFIEDIKYKKLKDLIEFEELLNLYKNIYNDRKIIYRNELLYNLLYYGNIINKKIIEGITLEEIIQTEKKILKLENEYYNINKYDDQEIYYNDKILNIIYKKLSISYKILNICNTKNNIINKIKYIINEYQKLQHKQQSNENEIKLLFENMNEDDKIEYEIYFYNLIKYDEITYNIYLYMYNINKKYPLHYLINYYNEKELYININDYDKLVNKFESENNYIINYYMNQYEVNLSLYYFHNNIISKNINNREIIPKYKNRFIFFILDYIKINKLKDLKLNIIKEKFTYMIYAWLRLEEFQKESYIKSEYNEKINYLNNIKNLENN